MSKTRAEEPAGRTSPEELIAAAHSSCFSLALSNGLGACVNAGFLYAGLRSRGIYIPQPGWIVFFLKLAVAVAVMGGLCWYSAAQFDWTGMQATPWLRAGALFAIVGLSAAAYFAVLFALGFRVGDFKRRGK